jgi:hypothetical protein
MKSGRGKALPQQQAGEDRDQHGANVDEHGGGTRIHATLAGVERDVVRAEPEQSADEERRAGHTQLLPAREPLALRDAERAHRDDCDAEPAERQGARRERGAGRADPDERGRPEDDGHERRADRTDVGARGLSGGGAGCHAYCNAGAA